MNLAGQGLFNKACNILSSGRLFVKSRLTAVTTQQSVCLKSESSLTKEPKLPLPEKPKRPLSPFLRFIEDHRSSISATHPNVKCTEVVKKCSQDWKQVDANVKAKYEEEYHKAMKDYTEKYLKFKTNLTSEQIQAFKTVALEKRKLKIRRKLRKEIKASGKPKAPLQPYMQFIKHQLETRKLKLSEALKHLSQEWKELSEIEKQKFSELYKADKQHYEKELKQWEQKMIKEGKTDLVRKGTIDKLDPWQKKQIAESDSSSKNLQSTRPKKSSTVKTKKKAEGSVSSESVEVKVNRSKNIEAKKSDEVKHKVDSKKQPKKEGEE